MSGLLGGIYKEHHKANRDEGLSLGRFKLTAKIMPN